MCLVNIHLGPIFYNFYSLLDTGSIDDNFVLENRLLSRKKTFIRGIKLTSDSFCIKELSKIQNYSSNKAIRL